MSLQAASIYRLPADVAAQLKSSIAISSLNHVVLGLIENALDAGAGKVSISIDYGRGSCTVEDNGSGILPRDFGVEGGLCKPYCKHISSKMNLSC